MGKDGLEKQMLRVIPFVSAVKTTGILREGFPKSPSGKVPLLPELLELQAAPVIPF